MKVPIVLALAASLTIPLGNPAAAPAKALVFDVEIVDTSGEGAHPDHAGRLARMTGLLRDGLANSGRYEIVAIPDADKPASVRACNGCDIAIGRQAGADIVVTGFIHKISTLILNIQITLREVGNGEIVAAGNADIRGDNERSWRRGVEWLLRHRLLADEPDAGKP